MGGLLGLFTGFSLLSGVEMFELLVDLVSFYIKKCVHCVILRKRAHKDCEVKDRKRPNQESENAENEAEEFDLSER